MAQATKHKSAKLNLDKAEEWLDTQWQGDRICPICGKNDWLISDEVVEVRAYGEGRLVSRGSIFPLLSVVCLTCGNTLFFNALIAGLVEQPE